MSANVRSLRRPLCAIAFRALPEVVEGSCQIPFQGVHRVENEVVVVPALERGATGIDRRPGGFGEAGDGAVARLEAPPMCGGVRAGHLDEPQVAMALGRQVAPLPASLGGVVDGVDDHRLPDPGSPAIAMSIQHPATDESPGRPGSHLTPVIVGGLRSLGCANADDHGKVEPPRRGLCD